LKHVYVAGHDFGATTAWNTAKKLGKDKINAILLLDGCFLTLSADKEFDSDIPMLSVNSQNA
jgi:pimeloyl-ACP methyl ester carboxylesterase